MEKRDLTLKEKIQIIIKNQPAITPKKVSIISVILAVIVFGSSVVGFATKSGNESVNQYDGERLVKGSVVGDMMLGRSIKNRFGKNNYNGILDSVSGLWKDSDYVSGNLECALLDNPSEYEKNDKEIHINAEEKSVNMLKDAGFNLINLANNHLADFSEKGVVNTVETLSEAGLKYIGAGKNIEEAATYDVREINGVKIATVSVSDIVPKNFSATATEPGILSTKNTRYYQAVRAASNEADLVIVNIHWGVEYGLNESKVQQQLGKNLINFGADVVVGSHPHVLQPVEKYKDGIIFYSMGNFIFDQGWTRTKDSVLLNYYVDKEGNCTFEMIPLRIDCGSPKVTTNPFFVKRTLNTLTKRLSSSDYEIKSNTLLMKNAIKIEIKDKTQDAVADQAQQATDANGYDQTYSDDYGTTDAYGNTTGGTGYSENIDYGAQQEGNATDNSINY